MIGFEDAGRKHSLKNLKTEFTEPNKSSTRKSTNSDEGMIMQPSSTATMKHPLPRSVQGPVLLIIKIQPVLMSLSIPLQQG